MSAPKIALHGLEISVYTRIVRLVLVEKGIPYVFSEEDIFATDGPSEDYLLLNPFGNIPTLVDNGFTLYET